MKTNLYICAALVAAGMVGHLLYVLRGLEQAGTIITPVAYAKQRPYTVASAVVGAYLLMFVLYYVGQLNEVLAIFVGLLCSQALDKLRAQAESRLQSAEDEGQKSGV